MFVLVSHFPQVFPLAKKKNHVKVMNQNVNNKKVSFTPEISMTEPFNLRALAASTDNLHHPLLDCQKKITALIMFFQLLKLCRANYFESDELRAMWVQAVPVCSW
jgi:hypothetical protein